jgi:hypothetical protein
MIVLPSWAWIVLPDCFVPDCRAEPLLYLWICHVKALTIEAEERQGLGKVVAHAGLGDWIDCVAQRKEVRQAPACLLPAGRNASTFGKPWPILAARAAQVMIDQMAKDV